MAKEERTRRVCTHRDNKVITEEAQIEAQVRGSKLFREKRKKGKESRDMKAN